MRARSSIGWGLLLAVVVSFVASRAEEPDVPPVHPAPWALAATPDRQVLFAASGPASAVTELYVPRHRVRRTFGVGGTPRGLAVSPDGRTLAVSLDPEDVVALLDVETGAVRERIPCGRAPEGIAFDASGDRLFVANKLTEEVTVLDLRTKTVAARIPAGREPFALRLSPDGTTVAVASRRAAPARVDEVPVSEVTLIDAASNAVLRRVGLPSCHLSEDAAFTPDGAYLLVPAIRVRNLLPIVQVARGWVLSPVLVVVEVASGDVWVLPLAYVNEGFADPTGVAVSDDGERAYVASGGADEVAVIDLPALLERRAAGRPDLPERLALTREYVLRRVPVGDNPRGLLWLGHGSEGDLAVSNRLDDDVTFLLRDGDVRARGPFGLPIPDDGHQRGRRAFADARFCFQNAFSCISCHPEGHTDGLTYDFEVDGVGRNPVLNRSLLGLAGTAPYKWTGLNPSLQRQCGARFAMVLTRADAIPPDVLDDMAAWLLSLDPPRPRVDPLTGDEEVRAAIDRGRLLFGRARGKDGHRLRPGERCITCHPPPLYTNNQRTDVGTRGSLDDHGSFDVPHLTGTATKAPYLHDGRATSLEDVLRGLGDRHGRVSDLSDAEIRDLVLFLESL